MAKVKCNHCKSKFVYKSARPRSHRFDEVHLEATLGIKEFGDKYYCKECRQRHLIDKVFITGKAGQMGMAFPKEPDNEVIHTDLGVMRLLEKFKLVKKVNQ